MGVIGELLGGMDRQNKSSNLIPLIQLKWEDVEDPLLGNKTKFAWGTNVPRPKVSIF